MLIEYFCINNLFGYQDFEIKFKEKDTIFVGENGMGKTTILSILYHTVSLNFSELMEYEFDSIKIKYEDSSQFFLDKNDIELLYKRNHSGIPDRLVKHIDEIIEELNIDINDLEQKSTVLKIRTALIERGKRVPLNLIRDIVESSYLNAVGDLKEFIESTKKVLSKYKILYFPTYRRIEEDISNFQNDDRNLYEDNEIHYFESSRKRKRQPVDRGELIQFGMKDVQETIDDLLDTIKKTSIESFNKMTGELLQQYVNNDVEKDIELNVLSEKVILISLSRVGSEIKSDLQNQIVNMYNDKTLEENKYLMNFIINLVNKNHSLEHIDNKIQKFVEVCNGYLYGKKFIYDPSAVTLEISSLNSSGAIPLSKLSSGEKQIISTFSKIYLKDDKNLIILFDEPELSLSIDWQKKFIYDVTQSENCKFSISVTHSGYIFKEMIENATELHKYLKVVK
ncbi:hypothetical protein MY43_06000 [Listeria monocytogenes]|uniref:AAA family ATPase n=1 Tax=Listeria monocytogenes TaxID=1639 RepID=UPI0011EF3915|nr:AAA family ATPase [Listeria monocytogenes]EBB5846581.1 hypothetical protein [Listeria monocytogenes]EIQ6630590.1 AAA family ATPase [Listeria monocytogenes]EIZ3592317.1 AAA family ATPase [Listeria monocytogenes]EJS8248332.1 AAA family ATPase [Listeria monocytogenes]ELC1492270.1 AAA family ATPase [Listeria monocytogenes]